MRNKCKNLYFITINLFDIRNLKNDRDKFSSKKGLHSILSDFFEKNTLFLKVFFLTIFFFIPLHNIYCF